MTTPEADPELVDEIVDEVDGEPSQAAQDEAGGADDDGDGEDEPPEEPSSPAEPGASWHGPKKHGSRARLPSENEHPEKKYGRSPRAVRPDRPLEPRDIHSVRGRRHLSHRELSSLPKELDGIAITVAKAIPRGVKPLLDANGKAVLNIHGQVKMVREVEPVGKDVTEEARTWPNLASLIKSGHLATSRPVDYSRIQGPPPRVKGKGILPTRHNEPVPPSLEMVMKRGYSQRVAERIVAQEKAAHVAKVEPYGAGDRSVFMAAFEADWLKAHPDWVEPPAGPPKLVEKVEVEAKKESAPDDRADARQLSAEEVEKLRGLTQDMKGKDILEVLVGAGVLKEPIKPGMSKAVMLRIRDVFLAESEKQLHSPG